MLLSLVCNSFFIKLYQTRAYTKQGIIPKEKITGKKDPKEGIIPTKDKQGHSKRSFRLSFAWWLKRREWPFITRDKKSLSCRRFWLKSTPPLFAIIPCVLLSLVCYYPLFAGGLE